MDCLGAGADEPHRIDQRRAIDDQLREANLRYRRVGKARAVAHLARHRLDHWRKCVTVNECGVVVVEIEKAPSIDVGEVRPRRVSRIARLR
jgi:hypothetical protein